MSSPLSDDQLRAVMAPLEQGRTIEAIKVYRELTGVGLKEAKDAVEALKAGAPPPAADAVPAPLARAAGLSDEQLSAVLAELHASNKIGAIKLYRELTGSGLKEAKDAVEAFQARLHLEQPDRFPAPAAKGGCAKRAAVLAVAVAAGAWVALRYC